MRVTNKQWIVLSLALTAIITMLAIFAGYYRAVGVLLLPLGLWLNLRREPDQMQIRPAIRLIGFVFVTLAFVTIIATVITITASR